MLSCYEDEGMGPFIGHYYTAQDKKSSWDFIKESLIMSIFKNVVRVYMDQGGIIDPDELAISEVDASLKPLR
ncbi:hypothetical protein COLO4_07045 [Corchorus olitorius]|uniref:Uncharacterized protein n=1 Tax=Corchorus olitorius TaxID=93759 RepID=A0A1R3KLA8_9ROSI|nr:hypothetical protein COLO4_07045 [Corchorus olitorius]